MRCSVAPSLPHTQMNSDPGPVMRVQVNWGYPSLPFFSVCFPPFDLFSLFQDFPEISSHQQKLHIGARACLESLPLTENIKC